jgi:hypothetical protein
MAEQPLFKSAQVAHTSLAAETVFAEHGVVSRTLFTTLNSLFCRLGSPAWAYTAMGLFALGCFLLNRVFYWRRVSPTHC